MPCGPVLPVMPCGPVLPVMPCGPVLPVAPVAPLAPVAPVGMVKLKKMESAVLLRLSFALVPALPVVVVPTQKDVALAISTDAEARRQVQMLVDRAFMPGRNVMRDFMILVVTFIGVV
jgi:hypothetical protein